MRVKMTFDEIAVRGRRVWKEDGKRRSETVKFSQTENPFNVDADGRPKTRGQIQREIADKLNAWIKDAPEGEKRSWA